MDKFKPIISHQEGQNLFPGIPTVIKGDKSSTNITMKNTKDQIALTPYGASYMTPGQDYAFAGNTVAELPMAQMGGEDPEQDQIMQILQVYAQMKQIPIEELMQQLQSLPEEQQQQALSSIVQDVQKTMQEQQMGQEQQQPEMGQQDQQGMMEQEQEMPMAMHGGILKYQTAGGKKTLTKGQQVQKLMSFPEIQKSLMEFGIDDSVAARLGRYIDNPNGRGGKYIENADGNKGYDVTNNPGKYPEDYSSWSLDDGLRYTRLSGMNNPTYGPTKYDSYSPEETSLEVDRNNAYRYYPKEEYIIKNNTDTIPFRKAGGEAFPQANPYPHMYAQGGEAFPQAQTYLPYDRGGNPVPNFMFQQGGDLDQYGGSTDIDQAYQMMKRGGFYMNPKKKKGGKFDAGSFQDYVMKNGGYLPKHQFDNSQIGMPKTPNPISQFKPQAGPWNDYNTGTMTNDINSVINEPMTLKKNQSFFGGQDAQGNSIYNFDKIPDTGITSNQQQQQQQKRGLGFNTPVAARQVSALNNIGGFLQGINELKAEDKERAKGINSSAWMPVQQSNDRGDYMNNNGMFRPNDYQYSQSAPGMQNQQAFYAQAGGPLDMFEDGEEYDLDENTINLILAMGGSVEYL